MNVIGAPSLNGYRQPVLERLDHNFHWTNAPVVFWTGKALRLWQITAILDGQTDPLEIHFQDGTAPNESRYSFLIAAMGAATPMWTHQDNARGLWFPNGLRVTPTAVGPIIPVRHVIHFTAEVLGAA